jgi:putative intracellular protease/amidase
MTATKTIGFVFIEGFADWEFGLLSASAVEYFGARAVSLSPGGKPVSSIAGFRLVPERSTDPAENDDLDALAVIGSDGWAAAAPPDIAPLIDSVHKRGGVIGGICAGTLALARAGLFAGTAHTSNGRYWIGTNLPGYAGADRYVDVPYAVADRSIISAPGSAPGTFAHRFLLELYPDKEAQLAEMKAMFAREHAEGS